MNYTCDNCGNPIDNNPNLVPNRGAYNGSSLMNSFHSTPEECAAAESNKTTKVRSHTGGRFKTTQGSTPKEEDRKE